MTTDTNKELRVVLKSMVLGCPVPFTWKGVRHTSAVSRLLWLRESAEELEGQLADLNAAREQANRARILATVSDVLVLSDAWIKASEAVEEAESRLSECRQEEQSCIEAHEKGKLTALSSMAADLAKALAEVLVELHKSGYPTVEFAPLLHEALLARSEEIEGITEQEPIVTEISEIPKISKITENAEISKISESDKLIESDGSTEPNETSRIEQIAAVLGNADVTERTARTRPARSKCPVGLRGIRLYSSCGEAVWNEDGFTLLAGAEVNDLPENAIATMVHKREKYAGNIIEGHLVQDMKFASPAVAASFMSGHKHPAQEHGFWRNVQGVALEDLLVSYIVDVPLTPAKQVAVTTRKKPLAKLATPSGYPRVLEPENRDDLCAGTDVWHSIYGAGTVTHVLNGRVYIHFDGGTDGKIRNMYLSGLIKDHALYLR
ncbi:hypothetical protein FACS1894208_00760 [Clostridia bacterium]|nr:hypothetical protein FACS1894208_00760 [Clostridia bacterium]